MTISANSGIVSTTFAQPQPIHNRGAQKIGVLLFTRLIRPSNATINIAMPQLEQTLADLDRAAAHHVEMSAVVEMVRQLDANPNALVKLQEYSQLVVTAAWLHRIDTPGAALRHAQEQHASHLKLRGSTSAVEC